eukprot:Partr_v1_DN27198_c3_g3_i2_m15911
MESIIGLDCEWCAYKDRQPGKLSLVQVSTSKTVFLFRVCQMDGFPQGLQAILESNEILKVGRNLSSDKSKLAEVGVSLSGCVDISTLAKAHNFIPTEKSGLADIVAAVFGLSGT